MAALTALDCLFIRCAAVFDIAVRGFLAFCYFAPTLGISAETSSTEATLVFKADYENRQLEGVAPGIAVNKPVASDALQVDCTVARAGKCAVLSRVLPLASYISAGAYRAETDSMAMMSARYSAGDEFLYRFSLWVPPDWEFDSPKSIDSVWQFKRFSSPPDMFLAIKGRALVLRIGKSVQLTALPEVLRGQWMDVSLLVRWSDGIDGRVDGTVTGAASGTVAPLSYVGPTMRNEKPNAGYLKWGLYKPGKTDGSMHFKERMVRHDEIYVYRLK